MTTDAKTLISTAVDTALAVSAASAAEEYATKQQAEAAIGLARTAIQAAIDATRLEYGILAFPTVKALRELAARLLDLDRALAEELQTLDYTLISERSLLDLALQLYGSSSEPDIIDRVRSLHALNPQLAHPLRLSAGSTVVVYAR